MRKKSMYNYNDDTPVQDPYITTAFCPIDENLAEYKKKLM